MGTLKTMYSPALTPRDILGGQGDTDREQTTTGDYAALNKA